MYIVVWRSCTVFVKVWQKCFTQWLYKEKKGMLDLIDFQETGDRRQETGDRRQETGDRRQETGDRRQETGDRRQETGDRRFLATRFRGSLTLAH